MSHLAAAGVVDCAKKTVQWEGLGGLYKVGVPADTNPEVAWKLRVEEYLLSSSKTKLRDHSLPSQPHTHYSCKGPRKLIER